MLGWVGETLGKVGFPPFSLSLDGRVWWVGKGELQLRLLLSIIPGWISLPAIVPGLVQGMAIKKWYAAYVIFQ